MTSAEKIDQVLVDFEQHASTVEWELQRRSGLIRTVARRLTFAPGCAALASDCPLSWLAKTEALAIEPAAEKLGLTEAEAAAIANAADEAQHHDPVIRRRLLAACRLTEDAS